MSTIFEYILAGVNCSNPELLRRPGMALKAGMPDLTGVGGMNDDQKHQLFQKIIATMLFNTHQSQDHSKATRAYGDAKYEANQNKLHEEQALAKTQMKSSSDIKKQMMSAEQKGRQQRKADMGHIESEIQKRTQENKAAANRSSTRKKETKS